MENRKARQRGYIQDVSCCRERAPNHKLVRCSNWAWASYWVLLSSLVKQKC